MVVHLVAGVSAPHLYRDVDWIRATWYGNDWITLLLACPLLLMAVSGGHARRQEHHPDRFEARRQPTIVQTIVVAPDGKTRTTTAKGTDGKGQPVDSMSLYEKQ